jgi:molybdopterin-biosynthesis enzyme MoeA-like protein
MFAAAVPMLEHGAQILSAAVEVFLRESEFAVVLERIQLANTDVEIGSYPFNRDGRFGATLVVRGTDDARLALVVDEIVAAMLTLGGEVTRA